MAIIVINANKNCSDNVVNMIVKSFPEGLDEKHLDSLLLFLIPFFGLRRFNDFCKNYLGLSLFTYHDSIRFLAYFQGQLLPSTITNDSFCFIKKQLFRNGYIEIIASEFNIEDKQNLNNLFVQFGIKKIN